jgi:hypothetical protein
VASLIIPMLLNGMQYMLCVLIIPAPNSNVWCNRVSSLEDCEYLTKAYIRPSSVGGQATICNLVKGASKQLLLGPFLRGEKPMMPPS